MALRGKRPEEIEGEKRLKALFYGDAGVGKTLTCLQFPKPYLIDCEKGAVHKKYTDALRKSGGISFQTNDFDELITEIKALLSETHEYKTLIIDPLTTIYNDLTDKASLKVGTEFGRHIAEADKKMKHVFNLLTRLDMNVIITSHAKNEYGQGMVVLGQTYDCYKKIKYLFDVTFEIQLQANQRVGIAKKTRLEGFIPGDRFEFTYEEIANRYDRSALERDAIAQPLATDKQVKELKEFIDLLKIDQDMVDKWLDKAHATSFSEMNQEDINKCITFLKSKINGTNL